MPSSNGAAGNGSSPTFPVHSGSDLRVFLPDDRYYPGWRFLMVSGAVLLVLCIVVFALFVQWRADHQALARYGSQVVAPTVDPLAQQTPPGVPPLQWQQAVADTHAMLAAVTGAGLLDRSAMEALRRELEQRVARTRPTTAVQELTELWDEMEAKAGPALTRDFQRPPHPPKRPMLLRRKPEKLKRSEAQ